MFLNFKVLLYSLFLVGGMEFIVFNPRHVIYFIILNTLISFWISMRLGGGWRFSLIPTVFTFAAFTMLYMIDNLFSQHVFIVISFSMYYFSLLATHRLRACETDQTAQGLLAASVAAAIFYFFSAAYGFYLNFLVPLWLLMLAFLISTLMVSLEYFQVIEKEKKKVVLTYSILLGLAMAEVSWTINFWPFSYLTAGAIALIFYYVLWDLTRSHFLNILSRKRVVANMVLMSFLIALVIISSKWLPSI